MKQKRYWLWGGFIGLSIMVLGFSLTMFIPSLYSLFQVGGILSGPIFMILNCSPINYGDNICELLADVSSYVILYPVMGIILGWIYGKIKYRNYGPH
jgi:hypothetical protein